MVRLTRKERERRRHRRAILAAAEEVFGGKGFHNATVQEVADRAEFAVGTIYNMFENKADIYRSLIRLRAREYLDEVAARIDANATPCDKVRTIVAAKVEFFERHQEFFRIFSREGLSGDIDTPFAVTEEGRAIYQRGVNMVRDVFEEGIQAGVFFDADPMGFTLALEGMTDALLSYALHNDGTSVGELDAGIVERILFDGILTEGSRP